MMRKADELEQAQSTILANWLDGVRAEHSGPAESDEERGIRELARRLREWQTEPSPGLLRQVAAISGHSRRRRRVAGPRIWRRSWVIAAAAIIAVITAVVSVPYTRNAVAGVFGFEVLTAPELQISVPFTNDLSIISSASPGLSEDYRILLVELPANVQWLDAAAFEAMGYLPLEAGTALQVGEAEQLMVPAGLPEGFVWRGAVLPDAPQPDCAADAPCPELMPSIGRVAAPGGDEIRVNAAYLVATDGSGGLVILAQLSTDPGDRVSVKAFHAGGGRQLGLFIEPTDADIALSFLVADKIQQDPVVMLGDGAVSYAGTWSLSGDWNDEDGWINVVWERDDAVYHLYGQDITVEELVEMATAMVAP